MLLRIFTEPQQGADYATLLSVARAAEELGFDAFFRSDHYLTMAGSGLPGPTDAWITLAGLAVQTSRIRLGTLMSPVTFRLPGPLAIAVAQVDQMSGGRAELGLGTGWFDAEHTAYGIPFPPLAERFGRLEEQLEIITGLWETAEGETFSFSGTTTRCPAHRRCPSRPSARARRSWSAAPGSAGRRGWRRGSPTSTTSRSPASPPARPRSRGCATPARRRAGIPDRWCTRPRRPCAAAGTRPNWPAGRRRSATRWMTCRQTGLAGSPAEVVDKLGQFADAGAARVYLQVLDLHDLDHLELIAAEVMPQVR